jgi:ribose transport system permease protein
MALFMHRTVPGRRLYTTGANPRAANLTRVHTGRVCVAVFAASVVIATLVSVRLAGFAGADQSVGDAHLFQGRAAIIVGGTTIMGR